MQVHKLDFPPMASPNPDRFDRFIQSNHDFLSSSFDGTFRLCDFFDAEPDKALSQHLEATNALLPPPETVIDRKITPASANSSHPPPQSHHSLKAAVSQATERSSSSIKSNSFTEAEWQEIFNVVLPIYLKKSVKEILETLPERTTHKPRFVRQRHKFCGG